MTAIKRGHLSQKIAYLERAIIKLSGKPAGPFTDWPAKVVAHQRELETLRQQYRELPPRNARTEGLKREAVRIAARAAKAKQMAEMLANGKNLRETGDAFGVSYERVRQILTVEKLGGYGE